MSESFSPTINHCTLITSSFTVRSSTNLTQLTMKFHPFRCLAIATVSSMTLAYSATAQIHPPQAKVTRSGSFVTASTLAKIHRTPFAIYVHGSSWHPVSRVFKEKLWDASDLQSSLHHAVILSQIHIRQHLSKEQQKAAAIDYKGWKANSVRSYPAIQIYTADALLLKTYSGKELRILSSPRALAAHLDHILALAKKRKSLIKQIQSTSDKKAQLQLLTTLIELPLNHGPLEVKLLKQIDPDDSSGWQAQLLFKNWNFVRHITALAKAKKTAQALQEIAKLLENPRLTTEQRCLTLGAKGKVLLSLGKTDEAWQAFLAAYQTAPKSPNALAMLNYGIRTCKKKDPRSQQ